MINSSILSQQALQDILDEGIERTQVPGIAAAVISGGERYFASSGTMSVTSNRPIEATARFEMSCLMKFFISIVALDLAASGRLDLDQTLGDFLPDLAAIDRGITIRHLLSHTSGYRGLDITNMRVRWHYSWDRFVQFFGTTDQSFGPGTLFNYEHSEHVILGKILQSITGKAPKALVRELLFDRLDIGDPGKNANQKDLISDHVPSRSGKYQSISIPHFCDFWEASLPDWTISLPDVVTIAAELYRPGGSLAPFILDRLLQAVICLPAGVPSDSRAERLPKAFGNGCAHFSAGEFGHNGSMLGQTCGLRFVPEARLAVVVGVNAWSPEARDFVLQKIVGNIRGGTRSTAVAKPVYTSEQITSGFSFEEVTGRYAGSYRGEINVVRDGQSLQFQAGAEKPGALLQIVPSGADRYRIESSSPASVGFFQAGVSRIPALSLGVHSYKKIA